MDGRGFDSANVAIHAVLAEPTAAANSSLRSKVLLPVDTIRSSKLQTGDAIAVTVADSLEAVVGIIWPSIAVSNGTVRLPAAAQSSSALRAGQKVTLVPLCVSDAKSSKRPSIASVLHVSVSTISTGSQTALSEVDRQMLAVYTKQILVNLECVQMGQELSMNFQGSLYQCRLQSCVDADNEDGYQYSLSTSRCIRVCLVSRSTDVIVSVQSGSHSPPPSEIPVRSSNPYAQLGGLDRQIQEIKALIEMPLMHPEVFHQYGLRPPKGVLLYGPPGTGKTSLARAVAAATGSSFLTINGPELSSAFHGETESKLREVFKEARAKSPCIVIIDEIDALAPRREGGSGAGASVEGAGEVERRVVAQLLTLLDGMDQDEEDDPISGMTHRGEHSPAPKAVSRVVVLAATNRPNAIDPALRRPGRIDREIEIGIPSAAARGEIIRTLIRPVPNTLASSELDDLAGRTHGYVGADLSALVREAGMRAVRRAFDRQNSLEAKLESMSFEISGSSVADKVVYSDFVAALSLVRPSAMREIFLEPPKVYWSDIAGSSTPSVGGGGAMSGKSVQSQIRELVEWPIKHTATFQRLGITPPRGVLLYGPPGCSKTLIARALATESGLNFLAVKGPELYSKYVGESERAVREIFKKARAAAPSIIFFDEMDALSASRDGDGDALNSRIIASLLNEMDGIEALSDVIIIGATNRPQALDPALLRPGRLDRLVYVGPPDQEARKEIMRKRMLTMATPLDQIDLDRLAVMTHGCSGAEVVSVCQEAGLLAMDENIDCETIDQRHYESAASSVKRRITPQMVQQYEAWRDTLHV